VRSSSDRDLRSSNTIFNECFYTVSQLTPLDQEHPVNQAFSAWQDESPKEFFEGLASFLPILTCPGMTTLHRHPNRSKRLLESAWLAAETMVE
jgi:hypothetical protein